MATRSEVYILPLGKLPVTTCQWHVGPRLHFFFSLFQKKKWSLGPTCHWHARSCFTFIQKKPLLACSYMSLACSEFVLLLPKKNASLALHGIGTPRSILPKTPTRGTCAKGANIVFLLWFFILGEFICRSLWSHSRQPRWSEHLQCWRGQKKGRMSMAMECRGGNNCCSTFRLY